MDGYLGTQVCKSKEDNQPKMPVAQTNLAVKDIADPVDQGTTGKILSHLREGFLCLAAVLVVDCSSGKVPSW